mmetsp:Transcript_15640/g.51170  ORF Transcript_15640/g.51170 Transcript_15640/m.51170 type:complete len:260 (+) Transcript_15640:88-867(+)
MVKGAEEGPGETMGEVEGGEDLALECAFRVGVEVFEDEAGSSCVAREVVEDGVGCRRRRVDAGEGGEDGVGAAAPAVDEDEPAGVTFFEDVLDGRDEALGRRATSENEVGADQLYGARPRQLESVPGVGPGDVDVDAVAADVRRKVPQRVFASVRRPNTSLASRSLRADGEQPRPRPEFHQSHLRWRLLQQVPLQEHAPARVGHEAHRRRPPLRRDDERVAPRQRSGEGPQAAHAVAHRSKPRHNLLRFLFFGESDDGD